MIYDELAEQFLQKSYTLRNTQHQRILADIMQGEMFALVYIAQNGDGVLPGEISRRMNVSSARVATALNSLEKKGLITRQIDTSDRRRILVYLTADGKKLAQDHKQMVFRHTVDMLRLLGEQDAKELVRIMEKMINFTSNEKKNE